MRATWISRGLLQAAAPLLLTALLLVWTLTTAPFTTFGNRWAVYPAIAILPLTFLLHIVLIVAKRPRLPYILYAIVHMAIQAYLWQVCLILISKDWL